MRRFWLVCMLLGLWAPAVLAADHFLILGGGYAPDGNQVSLERNVVYFRSVLKQFYPQDPVQHLYFSDGNDAAPDVQFLDTHADFPKARALLAAIWDEEEDLHYRYRNNALGDVNGPLSTASVHNWFDNEGQRLQAGDRLVLYVTGHGGHGDNHQNNNVHLWGDEDLSVKELSSLLDGLPREVEVVTVMVQCYSGGFASMLFAGGDSGNEVAPQVRCGFFATVAERMAAGCTPEVDEGDYQDYSTHFFAALLGRKRSGEPLARCDTDNNGHVSFLEAHAHAILEDDSIDVPVKTSDLFLRLRSDPGASGGRLMEADEMFGRLEGVATPVDLQIINGLSAELKIGGQYRVRDARSIAEQCTLRQAELEKEEGELNEKLNPIRDALQEAVEFRYPQLANRLNADFDKTLQEQGEAIAAYIESQGNYSEFQQLREKLGECYTEGARQEVRWAKCQRLVRAVENVALAYNLDIVADEEVKAAYARLVKAEGEGLGERRNK